MWYENYLVKKKDVIVEVLKKLITVADAHYNHCPSNHDYVSGFVWSSTHKRQIEIKAG